MLFTLDINEAASTRAASAISTFRNPNENAPNWSDKAIGQKTVTVLKNIPKRMIAEVGYIGTTLLAITEVAVKLLLTLGSILTLPFELFISKKEMDDTYLTKCGGATLLGMLHIIGHLGLVVSNPVCRDLKL